MDRALYFDHKRMEHQVNMCLMNEVQRTPHYRCSEVRNARKTFFYHHLQAELRP